MNTTDIITGINRTTGAIECAAEIGGYTLGGYILRRSYMGYTKAEARHLFAEAVAKAEADAEQWTVAATPLMFAMIQATTAAALIVARGYSCDSCGATGLAADEFVGVACVDCVAPIAYGLTADGVDIDAAIAASARFLATLADDETGTR